MEKAIKVFREIGIAILILACIAVAALVLFVDKIPIAVEIPKPELYILVDRSDFIVETNGIEDAQNETVIYESTTEDLDLYTDELRYSTGKTEPLANGNSGVSDIPTDIIQPQQEKDSDTSETT